jgi:flap endonuclease-1
MGIKDLNRYLLNHCLSPDSISKNISLSEFKGKIIVVDTSIYIYKFLETNALIENMYLLISIMLDSGIIPVFIFDGKPPPEKRELLYQRKLKKKEAEQLYNELKLKQDQNQDPDQEIHREMEWLQKQFLRINHTHIQIVKDLLTAYGIEYYVASGEADELCAQLVISNKAWACMSDDMDLLVYGCPRVIRHLSLLNKKATLYNMNHILKDLHMTLPIFRQIMVLSGTDYYTNTDYHLQGVLKWYNEFCLQPQMIYTDFFEWLKNIHKVEIEFFQKIISMFLVSEMNNSFMNTVFKINEKKEKDLYRLLQSEGFLVEL